MQLRRNNENMYLPCPLCHDTLFDNSAIYTALMIQRDVKMDSVVSTIRAVEICVVALSNDHTHDQCQAKNIFRSTYFTFQETRTTGHFY